MPDGIAKWALSQMSQKARDEMYRARREAERKAERKEEKAKNLASECLEESYKIDASKITLEDLENIPKYYETHYNKKEIVDMKDTSNVPIIWALGRYLLQEDRDFTQKNEIDILQRYLEIINPKCDQYDQLFPMYDESYETCVRYYEDFLCKLHINDKLLSEIMKKHPCPHRRVFNCRPQAFTKQQAQQFVSDYFKDGIYYIGEDFRQIKDSYIKNFGNDFDTIAVTTKDGTCTVRDLIHKMVQNESHDYPDFRHAPEYLIECIPDLALNHSYEGLKSHYVTEENKDGLGKILEKMQVKELENLQNKTDKFFEQEGNLKYILLRRNELKWKQPEIAENPNLTMIIYSDYIRAKYGKEYELLLNLKRIKESPEKRLTLYVPEELVGWVIGKGGSNIKKIEEITGKKFQVLAGDFRIAQKAQDAKDRIASRQQPDTKQGNNSSGPVVPKGPNVNDGR